MNGTVAVFGATGFTGRIVSRYLFNRLKNGGGKDCKRLSLMLVGRSETKLNELMQELEGGDESVDVRIRIASTDAPHTLDAVASGMPNSSKHFLLLRLQVIAYGILYTPV